MVYTPLKMKPCYQQYLWGGTRLRAEFGKRDAPEIAAESWELSAHPAGQSLVTEGDFAGESIAQLGTRDKTGFWGRDCQGNSFPILVKLIDAAQDLSIQVHPSDQTALAEQGEQGKAEMWYIVDCVPQSYIYFGFSQQISHAEFLRRAADGSICQVLNKVPVAPGDVFYILPGTIHAIGAGIIIAEIQQSSNTTFRVFDYQRRGADGALRPLHLERAASVVNYEPILPEECKANSSMHFSGFTMDEMFTCKYFRAYSIDVHHEISLYCDGRSFHHLLCVKGEGEIVHRGKCYVLNRGDSYFMPAQLGEYQIKGGCRVLLSRI